VYIMKFLPSLLTIVLIVALAGCSENMLTESSGTLEVSASTVPSGSVGKTPLRATNHALFNLGLFDDPINNPSWYGTFTANGVDYGQVFFSLGSGKPFEENIKGRAFFAMEYFYVYTWIDFDPATQTLITGDLLMKGLNTGVQDPQGVFHAHTVVLEAYGPFAMYEGRHGSGAAEVEWAAPGIPYSASGILRLQ
jgi:hypothetical protein